MASRSNKELGVFGVCVHVHVRGHAVCVKCNFLAGEDQQQTNQPNDLAGG